MSDQRFEQDVTYEADTALRDCGRAFQQAMLDAAGFGGWGSSGLALRIVELVEEGGGKFIDATAFRFETAWNSKGADRLRLKSLFKRGLDRFMEITSSWGRDTSGAFADSQSGLLDQMQPDLEARLRSRLEHAIRGVESAPIKPWRERHPFWWTTISAVTGGAIGQALAWVGRHLP